MPLESLIKQVEKFTAFTSRENLQVSGVSVEWHLKHLLLVIIGIIDQLKASDPASYQWQFNPGRSYIFLRGSIPRGRGRTPSSVDPAQTVKPAIKVLLKQARERQAMLAELPARSHFKHPYFGVLRKSHALKFLVIHTKHHLSIVEDILK